MAVPLRTYGNTLSELQAGTNAAQALDYQRANAQDAINQQRLESFLRLRGDQLKTDAQQRELAANRAQRMAELLQQNSQFGTSQANQMKLGAMDAASRLAVAKATAEGRGVDPRIMDAITDREIFNREGKARVTEAQQLSQQRKAALAEISAADADGYFWNNKSYGEWKKLFGREPNKKTATEALNAINLRAGTLGLIPLADGGLSSPDFEPLQTQNLGRLPSSAPLPATEPAVPTAQVPAMLQRGDFDIVPGSPIDRMLNPVPAAPPMFQITPTPAPRPRLRFDPGTMDFAP